MSVVLQSGWNGGTYGPNNPRIGWNSTGKRGAISASSEEVGYAAINAVSPLTDTYWRPTSATATYEIDTTTAEAITYCGIAAHNLGSTGCAVAFQTHDGSAWVTHATASPSTDATIMFLCDTHSASRARISITGTLAPTIAVIAFGEAIEVPQRLYQGYTPVDLAAQVAFKTTITQGGQFSGRSIQRTGARGSLSISHVTEAWFRANMLDFVEEARTRPFFVAERPQSYPSAIDYCFTDQEIMFERTGPKSYGGFSL